MKKLITSTLVAFPLLATMALAAAQTDCATLISNVRQILTI
jgi:hypothetical protein